MISAKDLVNHWEKTAAFQGLENVPAPYLAALTIPASAIISGQVARAFTRDDEPYTLRSATRTGAMSGLMSASLGAMTGAFPTQNPRHVPRNTLLGAGLGALGGMGLAALKGHYTPTKEEINQTTENAKQKLIDAGVSLDYYLSQEIPMEEKHQINRDSGLSAKETYFLSFLEKESE